MTNFEEEIAKRDARIAKQAQEIERLESNLKTADIALKVLQAEVRHLKAQQPSAGVAQGIDIDAAAKALAQCMDYPWDFMPERGREAMREHVRSVIGAALLNPCRAQSVPEGYVMVPVEPTQAMVDALKGRIGVTHRGGILNAGHAIAAAIAAAPSAKKEG